MLQAMQRARIIHTDIKPDNFLVMWPPGLLSPPVHTPVWTAATAASGACVWGTGCVQLIDFGRAIDLSLLGAGTQFVGSALTEGMQCPEMMAGKPWHYCVRPSTCASLPVACC